MAVKQNPAAQVRTLRGQFYIAAGEIPNLEYMNARGWWAGVLTGEGLTPIAMLHEERAWLEKWPEAGQVVPVHVTLGTPVKLKILWGEVPTRKEWALEKAQTLLETLRQHSFTPNDAANISPN